MRLTYATAVVLHALAQGYGYGFEIIEVTGLGAGTVYPILRRLDDEQLVHSAWEDPKKAQSESRPPRRNYRLTAAGGRMVAEALARYPALARSFGDVAPA